MDFEWRVAVLIACSMLAAVSGGCGESTDPSSGIRVEGAFSGDCEDEADNDGDGLYDCDDPSCEGLVVCQRPPGGSGGSGGTGGGGAGGTPGTGGTGGSTGTGGTGGAGGVGIGECPTGPLTAPIANCQPATPPSTGDPELDCVQRINQLRWDCQCLPPLQRWTEGESCAAEHAEYDSTRPPHSGIRDNICSPGGWAQNECPAWDSIGAVITGCLQGMWDEGPGEPYEEHGHYINMTNPSYTMVACGFYESQEGKIWSVQNFQ